MQRRKVDKPMYSLTIYKHTDDKNKHISSIGLVASNKRMDAGDCSNCANCMFTGKACWDYICCGSAGRKDKLHVMVILIRTYSRR